jgi:hypothetical protein
MLKSSQPLLAACILAGAWPVGAVAESKHFWSTPFCTSVLEHHDLLGRWARGIPQRVGQVWGLPVARAQASAVHPVSVYHPARCFSRQCGLSTSRLPP